MHSHNVNRTHDASATSWVSSANAAESEFPLQNLPFCCVALQDGETSIGIGIGDQVLLVSLAVRQGLRLGDMPSHVSEALAFSDLSKLMRLEPEWRHRVREYFFDAFHSDAPLAIKKALSANLRPISEVSLEMPTRVPNYTDFFASIHHALSVGKLFRPDAPLLPNYKHIPIAYHGRASTVRVSGEHVRRPSGQTKPAGAEVSFGPSRRLDYEMELGFWIAQGSDLGRPVPIGDAASRFFGCSLLNDWSARDIQSWEYQPLGPFLAKNFLTTISPWIVTAEALAPFRVPGAVREAGDPEPLEYLACTIDRACGGIDLTLQATISTEASRASGIGSMPLGSASTKHLYWTIAQMIAHHASNGCALEPGDLFGSGTVSGPTEREGGSLLELSKGGARPFELPNGEARSFLHDGDELTLTGRCARDGFRAIGFGQASGRVCAASN